MQITPNEAAAKRLNYVLARHAHLPALIDALEDLRRAEIDHARTNRDSDYLYQLQCEYVVAELIGKALGWDTCEEQDRIADEARSQCSFDIPENTALNYMGEPILPCRDTRHPDDNGRGFRL